VKFRESGMPSEELWDTFFSPIEILEKLEIDKNIRNLMDIGCGYGTFLLPAAQLISGTAIGIDIDNEMIDISQKKIKENEVTNVKLFFADVSSSDLIREIELYRKEIDYITLFNILHCEEPIDLLKRAYDLLTVNGKLGVMHWNREETPRGPSLEIRPKPEMIMDWASKVGFNLWKQIALPPFHFSLIFTK